METVEPKTVDPPLEPEPLGPDEDGDLGAEMTLLGEMLLSRDAVADVALSLTIDDLSRRKHQLIYEAILDLYARGDPPDTINVGVELKKRGRYAQVGGLRYIKHLEECATGENELSTYVQVVRGHALQRSLKVAARRIARVAHETSPTDIDQAVDFAQSQIFSLSTPPGIAPCRRLDDVLEDALDEVESGAHRQVQALTHGHREVAGLASGLSEFDDLTDGLRGGELVVLSGRAAMGTSTLALNLLRSCSITMGMPSVLFSLEMSQNEIALRILAAECRVPLGHLRSGVMHDNDWLRLTRRMPDVARAPLHIQDAPRMTLTDIRSQCRRLKHRSDIRLAVIDYLGLLDGGRARPFASRYEEAAHCSRQLKLLARELEIPIVLVTKLNRGPETRPDHRPLLPDLRDSGTLEDDANFVIFVHREDAYDKETPRQGEADLIVAKSKQGRTGTAIVGFDGAHSRYVDLWRPTSTEQDTGPASDGTEGEDAPDTEKYR